ncbi:hypothetical protein EVAR_54442_1 [Eumeta japonica]|uniref:Uncharacterized protein n=1 Tax=Eumeta variegata TaxID=151549 RepID=A0A4C1XKC9_EUMVA|nr:hypothetical protein EVAR_54442_1 [Eumeta japonica]
MVELLNFKSHAAVKCAAARRDAGSIDEIPHSYRIQTADRVCDDKTSSVCDFNGISTVIDLRLTESSDTVCCRSGLVSGSRGRAGRMRAHRYAVAATRPPQSRRAALISA